MKIIGIAGSRRRDSSWDYLACLNAFRDEYSPGDRIVSGGCPRGGDRFAEIIAGHVADDEGRELSEVIKIHLPDKSKLDPALMAKNPRAAHAVINNERNGLIAHDCDVLIAVVAQDRKGGTEDTIRRACGLGKPVVLVEAWPRDSYGELIPASDLGADDFQAERDYERMCDRAQRGGD